MSFFDKMKSGMNQVKDKAAQTVEITRISSQISGKKKDKAAQFTQLGEFVHQAYSSGQLQEQIQQIDASSQAIDRIDNEIEELEAQLRRVKGEKTCSCGAVVSVDAKFCNSCGNALQAEPVPVPSTVQSVPQGQPVVPPAAAVAAFCTNCGSSLEEDAQFCSSCGAKVE